MGKVFLTNGLQRAGKFVLLVASGIAAIAQTTSVALGTRVADGQVWFPNGGSMSAAQLYATGSSLQPVTGLPYSAEQVVERGQAMADGIDTRQTLQKATLYRDTEGRTRTETSITPPSGAVEASPSNFIEIIDPNAGYRYILDPHGKIARRSTWPPAMQRANRGAVGRQPDSASGRVQAVDALPANKPLIAATTAIASSMSAVETKLERLGTRDIEGLTTEGTLTATTYPSGLMGNEKPITTTWEHWISPELKIIVLAKTSDSRYGRTTVRLTRILRAEPDPSLFQIPSDYLTLAQ